MELGLEVGFGCGGKDDDLLSKDSKFGGEGNIFGACKCNNYCLFQIWWRGFKGERDLTRTNVL